MASDEEEEELAQLRAQRSQRIGVADLVSNIQVLCMSHNIVNVHVLKARFKRK